MHEFVVPRSMPIVLPIRLLLLPLTVRGRKNLSGVWQIVARCPQGVVSAPVRRPVAVAGSPSSRRWARRRCGDGDGRTALGLRARGPSTARPRPRPPTRRGADRHERQTGDPEAGAPRRTGSRSRTSSRARAAARGPGDNVVVHYAGVTFSTGEEFDSSWDTGRPVPFPLGGRRRDRGLGQGHRRDEEGGRRKLTIPPGAGLRRRRLARARDRPERDAGRSWSTCSRSAVRSQLKLSAYATERHTDDRDPRVVARASEVHGPGEERNVRAA